MSATTPFIAVPPLTIHSVDEAEKAIAEFRSHTEYHVQMDGKILILDTHCFACKKVWETCIRDGIDMEELKKYLR